MPRSHQLTTPGHSAVNDLICWQDFHKNVYRRQNVLLRMALQIQEYR